MQQVVIVGRKRDNKAIISALQDAGVLHIVPISSGPLSTGALTGPEAEARKTAERLLARAESTLSELGAYRTSTSNTPSRESFASIIEDAAAPAGNVARRLNELNSDIDAALTFGEVVRTLANLAGVLDRSRRIALLPFTAREDDDLKALDAVLSDQQSGNLAGRYALETRKVNTGKTEVYAGLLAVLREDRDKARAALGKARLGELRLPGRFDGMPLSDAAAEMERLSREGKETRGALEEERRRLAEANGPTLFAVRDALADEVAVYDVQSLGARGKYSLALEGYVPTDRVPDLKAALDKFGTAVSYEMHDVDVLHDERVPVQLKNNSYVKPFEMVLGMLNLPRYGTFDPTWVIALFFPFFFGYIIADIAFGLMFLAAGMWFLGKARRGEGWDLSFFGTYVQPDALRSLGFITNMMAAWSIVWGLLTGEFLGTLFEHLHIFYINDGRHSGLIPIVWPRIETEFANTALLFALAFGILQVLWGWAIRVKLSLDHGDRHHLWEALGMLGGLVGLIMLAFVSSAGKNLGAATNFGNPLVLVMYAGFLVFVVGVIVSKVWLMVVELMSQGGAIVSYARLFAVGLVSAQLAKLSTDLGWSIFQAGAANNIVFGILAAILGAAIALALHALALALTLIGHILQPLRLHFVEFLNPTGYHNETSPKYTPFRRLSPAGSKK
ncbi:V/A-type H+-transporting ATPase subunit I [Deinococcus yavapaiensis KR-236]|uniref:V/A-type H+-transporting ATPase subunit I n=2 Tax=Deinococcus TaxID=1298 RepID=A0A318S830_9DEIO|nr:V/A-type H+-transporting ATPase subunit I [Deinococcus yavapaiensis KR-236]